MKRLACAALFALLCAGCGEPQSGQPLAAPADAWRVERVQNSDDSPGVIHFAGAEPFETGLMRVEHLGTLPVAGKAPFLVLAGFGCNDCDINRSVYILSPADGLINGEFHPRYTYPGTLIEWESEDPNGEIIHRARVFVGVCTDVSSAPVVLWLVERPSSGMTAEIAKVEADTIRLDRLEGPQHVLQAAEKATRQNQCREIESFDQGREA